MTIESKQVVEWGETVTVYRVLAADGWSSLWHSDPEKALDAYMRRERRRLVRG